jgi:adenosylhomocysteine nucleosidase
MTPEERISMSAPPFILVCFAVKEEAKSFSQLIASQPSIRILVTGMGRHNAESAIRAALAEERPRIVLSAGFAGGLNPDMASGTVVFATDKGTAMETKLLVAGALSARFHCASRVATTVKEKRALREATGADAVEMESDAICAICRERKVPVAIVRVILDAENEDLPFNFNLLMTPDQRLDKRKLVLALLKSPGKSAALLRLQRQSRAAGEKLAAVLARAMDTLQEARDEMVEG